MNNPLFGVRGHLIDTPGYGQLRSIPNGALVIEDGLIAEVGPFETLRNKPRPVPIDWRFGERALVIPGLIDLHTHLPQYPAVARSNRGLLPWLQEHIFPLEREFTGEKARRSIPAFFHELARHGTTTAMIYAAIYEDTCDAAFAAAHQAGLRAIIGKMMMDVGSYGSQQPGRIASLSLQESERLCKKWHRTNGGLLEYAFAPRFAVSCTRKLMSGAASLAQKHGAYLQTHLAENLDELEQVRKLFPDASDYTDVYDRCGLLTERTVLGHCLHLTPAEIDRLQERRCAVAHCPTANLFLTSGLFQLERLRTAGLRIGLGSDVAAGPELNLWQVMRSAIETQKARAILQPGVPVPSPAEAFYLATAGAASALGKQDIIGTLEVGHEADLVVLDPDALLPGGANSRHDLAPEDLLSLCIYRGGPRAVLETLVRGRTVYRAADPVLF